jgi:heat-inducible transcriptional repressor
MSHTELEQRKQKILGLVVELYIGSATPVGSELIWRKLRQSVSPATIRHVMADLDDEGLLEQPHTSAGRRPTNRGYRIYVDTVMDAPHPAPEQVRQMIRHIEPEETDVEGLMEQASHVLAVLTHQAAFVLAPTVKHSTVKQIEVVPLGVRRILCVLIANDEIVASHVVETDVPMSRDEAAALVRFLNTELVGLPFQDLLGWLQRRLLGESDSFYHLVKRSLDLLEHALSTEPMDRLCLEGASYVVAQPEFARDPGMAHELLRHLEAEQELLVCLRHDAAGGGRVRVRIGPEMQWGDFDACSAVSGSFGLGREPLGTVGVLGPKRMDYRQVHMMVSGMRQAVTHVLTRWASTS